METATRSHHPVRLKSFELNLRTRELYCNGTRLNLHGHPIDVLAMLVEKPGELVTREAIQNKLWPIGSFVDSEHMLNNSIARLRDALGDHAEQPRYIETLPRLGYRFLAHIDGATGDIRLFVPGDHLRHTSDNPPAIPSLRNPPPTRRLGHVRRISKKLANLWKHIKLLGARRHWILLALSGIVVALLVTFSFVSVRNRPIGKNHAPPIRSLSVLPLVNLSGDPLKNELADSMSDSLIIQLSRIDSLKIIPRSSAMQYKSASKTLTEIARELKTDFMVGGSVSLMGDRVKTSVKLIDAPSGTTIWSRSYECDISDTVALERNVARDIASKIQSVTQH